ncbi:transposase [Salinimicrobium sp. TIG7-5_MAKvit]|uniref:transposase n=1 Tax=unclassified Salinimicrobium TaxID=2643747 RepID=UPI003C6E7970
MLRIKDAQDLPHKFFEKPHLAFSHFFNAYTKAINKRYGRSGSLFQEHIKRKRVEDERYLVQLIAYIHLNPVKHGFTEDYKSYRFSSYQAYKSSKPSLLKREVALSLIDHEVFEYWHDERKLQTEYLNNFLQHQT